MSARCAGNSETENGQEEGELNGGNPEKLTTTNRKEPRDRLFFCIRFSLCQGAGEDFDFFP